MERPNAGLLLCRRRSSVGGGRSDRCGLNTIDIREVFVEIGLPFVGNRALVRAFAIAAIELLDDVHAGSHLAKWRKALAVVSGIIPQIDEELGGASVRAGSGKGKRAGTIALGNRIVLDIGALPGPVDGRVGAEAELDDEAGNDAEEGGVVVEAMFDQVMKRSAPSGAQARVT